VHGASSCEIVSALHSSDGVTQTGLCVCRQRKTPENLAAGFDETLSPVRFEGKTYGIAAIFSAKYGHVLRISRQRAGLFLCSLDLLAEEAVWR